MSYYKYKTLYLIGGLYGGGKSELIRRNFDDGIKVLNPDAIAKKIGGAYPDKQAGRQVINSLQKWPTCGESLVWETVLSNNLYKRVIQSFKEYGYKIDLIYIYLEDEESHFNMVKKRVESGGHNIDSYKIHKKFDSRVNDFNTATKLVDRWRMIYRQESCFIEVANGTKSEKSVLNAGLYKKFDSLSDNIDTKTIKPKKQDKVFVFKRDALIPFNFSVSNNMIEIDRNKNTGQISISR